METRKIRLDFVAHYSVVVEVPDDENSEENAITVAEDYMNSNGLYFTWELEDGGIEDAEDNEEPVNNIEEFYDV